MSIGNLSRALPLSINSKNTKYLRNFYHVMGKYKFDLTANLVPFSIYCSLLAPGDLKNPKILKVLNTCVEHLSRGPGFESRHLQSTFLA